MERKYRDRLNKLANYIEKLPKKNFDFGVFSAEKHGCGTVGCAIGYMPLVFPKLAKFRVEASTCDDDFELTVNPKTLKMELKFKAGISDVANDINIQCKETGYENFRAAERIFNITDNQAEFLFSPSFYNSGSGTSAKVVAKRMKDFAAGKYSYEDIDNYIQSYSRILVDDFSKSPQYA